MSDMHEMRGMHGEPQKNLVKEVPEFYQVISLMVEKLAIQDDMASRIHACVGELKRHQGVPKDPPAEQPRSDQGGVLGELWKICDKIDANNRMLVESVKTLGRLV